MGSWAEFCWKLDWFGKEILDVWEDNWWGEVGIQQVWISFLQVPRVTTANEPLSWQEIRVCFLLCCHLFHKQVYTHSKREKFHFPLQEPGEPTGLWSTWTLWELEKISCCFWRDEKDGTEISSKIICRFLILLHVKLMALSLGTEILGDYFCLSLDTLVTMQSFYL